MKLSAYARLMRWHQPAGFYLILPATLWGLAAAYKLDGAPQSPATIGLLLEALSSQPDYLAAAAGDFFTPTIVQLVLIFTVGSLLMRSAGCIINDYWDADLDPQVARTKDRPLASGELGKRQALRLFAVLILAALVLVLLLPPVTILLGIIGIAGTAFYPLAKRYIQVPQLALGLVFSWGTVMAWSAVAGNLWHWQLWLLWLVNILWIISYDLQYALCDLADDKRIKINSGALYFAGKTPKVIVLLQGLVLALLMLRGLLASSSPFFYLMLLGGLALFAYFYNFTRGYTEPARCLFSFKNNHWFGWLVLAGICYN